MPKKLTADEWSRATFGTKMIKAADGATTSPNGAFDGFVIAEDDTVVIAVLDISGNDITSVLGLGVGRTFEKGNPVTYGGLMASIEVSAGTVNGINAKK